MSNDFAVRVKNVHKNYRIGSKKNESLIDTVSSFFSKTESTNEIFSALKNVSFEIRKGEVIGIIGKNGAGKSTLLKILSQITQPTKGRIEINGRVASLLEVGTGFHPELTGRENIYLNGTILGMTRKEVKEKFNEIVDFSGVQKFIDTPVKHYSSGMYVRLAFAVAAHLEPEILIIDEVLAVGDMEFQNKCLGKMKDVATKGRTVIFVSHSMEAISSLCSRVIIINKGTIKYDGNVEKGILDYINLKRLTVEEQFKNASDSINSVYKVNFSSGSQTFEHSESFSLEIESKFGISEVYIGIAVLNVKKNKVFTAVHWVDKKLNKIICEIPGKVLLKGNYSIDLATFKGETVYNYYSDICPFEILDFTNDYRIFSDKIGDVKIDCHWHEING